MGQGDQVRRHQAAVKLPEARYSITSRSAKMSAHGTFETSTDVRSTAAFGGNADISQRLPRTTGINEYMP
jgi:hypothetical protein